MEAMRWAHSGAGSEATDAAECDQSGQERPT